MKLHNFLKKILQLLTFIKTLPISISHYLHHKSSYKIQFLKPSKKKTT